MRHTRKIPAMLLVIALSPAILFAVDTAPATTSATQTIAPAKAGSAQAQFNVVIVGEKVTTSAKGISEAHEKYIQARAASFKSPELFQQTITRSNVKETTWFKQFKNEKEAIAALDKGLVVERVPDTTLIRLTLTANPDREIDILLNMIGEQYMNLWDLEYLKAQEARKARGEETRSPRQQLDDARRKLEGAQSAGGDFRALVDVRNLPRDFETTNAAKLEIENELGKLKTQRDLAASKNDAAAIAAIDARTVEAKKNLDIKQAEVQKLNKDMATYRADEAAVKAAREEFARAEVEFYKQDPQALSSRITDAERSLKQAEESNINIRENKDAVAATKAYETAVAATAEAERELNKLKTDHNMVAKAVDQIAQAQRAPDNKLPAEIQQQIERDPIVRSLDDTRITLEREREAELRTGRAQPDYIKPYDLKIAVVKRQLQAVRKIAEERFKAQLDPLPAAQKMLEAAETRLSDAKKKYAEKQAEERKLQNTLFDVNAGIAMRDDLARLKAIKPDATTKPRPQIFVIQFTDRAKAPK